MKKSTTFIPLLIFAIIMIFTITACGGSDVAPETTPDPTPEVSAETDSEPEPEDEEEIEPEHEEEPEPEEEEPEPEEPPGIDFDTIYDAWDRFIRFVEDDFDESYEEFYDATCDEDMGLFNLGGYLTRTVRAFEQMAEFFDKVVELISSAITDSEDVPEEIMTEWQEQLVLYNDWKITYNDFLEKHNANRNPHRRSTFDDLADEFYDVLMGLGNFVEPVKAILDDLNQDKDSNT